MIFCFYEKGILGFMKSDLQICFDKKVNCHGNWIILMTKGIMKTMDDTSRLLSHPAWMEGLGKYDTIVDFSKAFNFIDRGKMEQILLAYGFLQGTATAIMMLYKKMKEMFCSPDGDTDSKKH